MPSVSLTEWLSWLEGPEWSLVRIWAVWRFKPSLLEVQQAVQKRVQLDRAIKNGEGNSTTGTTQYNEDVRLQTSLNEQHKEKRNFRLMEHCQAFETAVLKHQTKVRYKEYDERQTDIVQKVDCNIQVAHCSLLELERAFTPQGGCFGGGKRE